MLCVVLIKNIVGTPMYNTCSADGSRKDVSSGMVFISLHHMESNYILLSASTGDL